jgi:hypothetical protein
MKLTNNKTDTIIVNAGCNDEHMSCDFAIIKINESKLWEILTRVKSIYEKEDGYSYYKLSCPFDAEFYISEDEGDIFDFVMSDNIWSYIELEDGETTDLFTEVDDRCESIKLNICQDGDFHITCNGKWTEAEFSTSMINIEQL